MKYLCTLLGFITGASIANAFWVSVANGRPFLILLAVIVGGLALHAVAYDWE